MRSHASVSFSETMQGFVTFGDQNELRGFITGRAARNRLAVHLTITMIDLAQFASDPNHLAHVEGWLVCDALGGRLPVERGTFNLFVATNDRPTTLMSYRLFVRDSVGHPITLMGVKTTRDANWHRLWRDTTTLYTRVLAGHIAAEADATAPVIATGLICIQPFAFLRQLATFRSTGASAVANMSALVRFGVFFVQHLWRVYGASVRAMGDAEARHDP